MFHHSRYGRFGGVLRSLADHYGFVPEPGDQARDFDYGHDEFTRDFDKYGNGYAGCAAEAWEEHVVACVDAKERADEALALWRQEQS